MESKNYLQMMIDSLNMKVSILKEVEKLNEEQTAFATTDTVSEDQFQENLDRKGALIDNLEKLDEGFDSLFQRIKKELEENRDQYAKEIKQMKQLITQVTELGVRVEAQEARNKLLIQNKFTQMRQDIQTAKRSTKMANTYYQNMNKLNYEPQFMDKKK